MEKENKTVSEPLIINLSNYNSPAIIETPGSKWVDYGADNNYFGYLLDRYRGSPTNNAIINAIAGQIVGNGLRSDYSDKRPEAYAKAKVLFTFNNLNKWAFDLKCYGWYMQVIVMNEDLTTIERIDYSPVQNWRSGKADHEGEVNEYWYSDNWMEEKDKKYKPEPYPVYCPDKKVYTSCLPVKPYTTGSFYYPNVDYQGALQYAQIEEEISNFHLNNIRNGLAPGMIINFNNGDPGEDIRRQIESRIKAKWGGSSNAGRFMLAFNDSKEMSATIETVQIPDLDKQYQFLSEESSKKIMVGHRVTSPLFFGIRDSSGLGSNADEIKNAWMLWERTVIQGYRNIMLENIYFVLNQLKLNVPLEFDSLSPIEFETVDVEEDQQKIEQSLHLAEAGNALIEKGETINEDEWDLVTTNAVNYDLEAFLDKSLVHLASVVKGSEKGESDQDTPLFKVRYSYAPETIDQSKKKDKKGNNYKSRDFCRMMVSAGKVYRKEDIIKAGDDPTVNPGWGPRGADTYNIFYYKGGGNCYHFWQRNVYLQKNNKKISVNEARRILNALPLDERDDNRFEVNNPKVAKRPRDMKDDGFLPKTK